MLRGGFLVAIYLADNEYALVLVILDAPWVSGYPRQLNEDTLDPLPEPGSLNR
jgi:hypothetical protein